MLYAFLSHFPLEKALFSLGKVPKYFSPDRLGNNDHIRIYGDIESLIKNYINICKIHNVLETFLKA